MTNTFVKYGLRWSANDDPLDIEMLCIQRGGQWREQGVLCGLGNSHHYEQMRRLIWPHLDTHRWHTLTRDEVLKNKVTVLMGPKSSGKTHCPAWLYLCEYWCFPDETCVLVSSTDVRGLELRVWGEIKTLHAMGKEKYAHLAGHLIDSKHCITTDNIDEGQARDLRKGIIGIPCVQNGTFVGLGKYCFPAGTMVDTPIGPTAIETIGRGDIVYSAMGESVVQETSSRIASQLVRVHLNNGRYIDCTPTHPFLIELGWVNAIDIPPHSKLFSWRETKKILGLHHLPSATGKTSEEILLGEVQAQVMGKTMSTVWQDVSSIGTAYHVLHSVLWGEMEVDAAGYCREDAGESGPGCKRGEDKRGHSGEQTRDCQKAGVGSQAVQEMRMLEALQHIPDYSGGTGAFGDIPKGCSQFHNRNWAQQQAGLCGVLQGGLSMASLEAGSRSRWGLSQAGHSAEEGHGEGRISSGTWVVGVEILKPEDNAESGKGEAGYRVYNLQVAGHPSYSVNGVIVHNCGIKQKRMRLIADEAQWMGGSFLSAFSNLDGNEDFRAVVLGNPRDVLDPLGKAAEPKDGWGSHLEPTKTDTWDTRFMNGRCVNLVGTDSPNFDYPEGEPIRFKYLISREKIATTLSFFAKDSVEYYSQCVGTMKIGMMEKRVITRDMCRKYNALEDVIWSGKPRKRIAGLDAAYGGDRCVLGWGEFGEDNHGHTVLKLAPPVIVPVIVGDRLPEEQIAEYCKQYCEANHVPPENFFHDSTGRGSLGTSLARVWSNLANPVEFGGSPTDRPVSMDLFKTDPKTNQRRLVLCSEYYVKFVTELWFSVRYVIEGSQLRGLNEDVMDEGCMREWDDFNGKKRLETKAEMKERTSRSPDLFDQLSILVEGARRRGFQIRRLSNEKVNGANPIADYLDSKRKKQKELERKKTLTYA